MRSNKKSVIRFLSVLLAAFVLAAGIPMASADVFADGLDVNLVDAAESYKVGDPIMVNASGTTEQGPWVALYPKGAKKNPDTGGVTSTRWYYVADHNGETVDITDTKFDDNGKGKISAGDYEIVLFGDGGYDNILKTIDVKIVSDGGSDDPEPEPTSELSLAFADPDKTVYKIGETIDVIATGTADGAWVGLYHADEKVDPNAGGVVSVRWYYIAGYNGQSVDIGNTRFDDNGRGAITEGEYKVILFGDSGYNNVIETLYFTVSGAVDIDPSEFTLSADKEEYEYEEMITVTASGKGIADAAWVGLYTAETSSYGTSYLYRFSIKDHENTPFAIQKGTKGAGPTSSTGVVNAGEYKLVLFASEGYSLPVHTVGLKVIRDTFTVKRIRDPGCVSYGLEYAVYTDGQAEYRTIPSLGGHLWGEAEHIDGTNMHKFTCSRDADHVRREECSKTQEKVLTAATLDKAGKVQYTCDVCGGTYTLTIPKLKAAPKLEANKFVYTGKNIKPKVKTVRDAGNAVISTDSYTVTYPTKCKLAGKYTAVVKFKGLYSGTYKLNYVISPAAADLTKVKAGSKSFKAAWTKAAGTSGTQVYYSTNKSMKGAKKATAKAGKTALTVKSLKKGKTYYVRVRTFRKVGGKSYYSAWSETKSVKVK